MLKSILTVGGWTMVSRVLGFARDMLIAQIMGAGPIADAFFVALKLPNLFRRLFGGGRAELKLLDPENVLESGIEIYAQPPGKKLENLNLIPWYRQNIQRELERRAAAGTY